MKDKHITDILDHSPLTSLSQEDQAAIHSHVEHCPGCAQAYEAARLSQSLIKARAAETFEPPPFFATRVMAAWRDQQSDNAPVMVRWWKAAGALVSTMALTTAALAVFTFAMPAPAETTDEVTTAFIPNTAEAVLLERESEEQISDEQALETIYEEAESAR